MSTDPRYAAKLLAEEAGRAEQDDFDAGWAEQIERLSVACERVARIYIAFLGTAILAKALDLSTDAFAIKAKSDQPGAYSARSLYHNVLVPSAVRLGISLGATGREPLNNMPFFRMQRIDDGTAIHPSARRAFGMLIDLATRLQSLTSEDEAKAALRAFIHVRRRHQPIHAPFSGGGLNSAETLAEALQRFVEANSEGGRRAQAAVAGLLDVAYGADRVETGRVNDPSRHYPGDVCVRLSSGAPGFEKAFEVRDKPVREHEVKIFALKCLTFGVRESAVVAVSSRQPLLPVSEVEAWAVRHSVAITIFTGWRILTREALFWASLPGPDAAALACRTIHARLIELEASAEAVEMWVSIAEA